MNAKFWSFDGEEVRFHVSAHEARQRAMSALEHGGDGWRETADQIAWGEVRERAVETERVTLEEAQARGDEDMVETMRAHSWKYHAVLKLESPHGSSE